MENEFDEEEIVENHTLKAAYNLAPLHQNQPLPWDYEVHLIGEKIYDKFIHLCEICELPILVYGRMLPCKHIFCFDCARQCEKTCRRCDGRVQKVEKSALGTVFVCTHGAPKHSTKGCRRTYLSQRDLQSHIAHRHMPKSSTSEKVMTCQAASTSSSLQLPLTQQQTVQQVTQSLLPTSGLNQHSDASAPLGALHTLAENISSISSSSSMRSMQPSGQSLSAVSVQSFIPGLGDLRAVSTMSSVQMKSNSPHIQAIPSSNIQNLSFSSSLSLLAASSEQSGYQSHDMPPQQQLHQQQHIQQRIQEQQLHSQLQQQRVHQPENLSSLGGSHIQGLGAPIQSSMMSQQQQQMSVASGSALTQSIGNQLRPQLQQKLHSVSSQNLDGSFKPQGAALVGPSRTNNLITVPIQDEGQYRPLPFVGPTQAGGSSFGQTLTFDGTPSISSGNFSNSNFTQLGSQNLPLKVVANSQNFGPSSVVGSNRMHSPRQAVGLNLNQQGMHQGNQNLNHTTQNHIGGNQNQSMLSGSQNMLHSKQTMHQGNQNVLLSGQNLHASNQNVHPSLTGIVQNLGLGSVRGNPVQGLISSQGNVPQGGTAGTSNLANQWGSPRQIIPPRMTQGQQRPHGDSTFNPNYYN